MTDELSSVHQDTIFPVSPEVLSKSGCPADGSGLGKAALSLPEDSGTSCDSDENPADLRIKQARVGPPHRRAPPQRLRLGLKHVPATGPAWLEGAELLL